MMIAAILLFSLLSVCEGNAFRGLQQAQCKIGIQCAVGYKPKITPSCNAFCIPDDGGDECTSDADCAIYCVTDPCPQPFCNNGGHCIETGNGGATGGQPCGQTRCGANSFCCNASCGICAPLGGGCIQIACLEE